MKVIKLSGLYGETFRLLMNAEVLRLADSITITKYRQDGLQAGHA